MKNKLFLSAAISLCVLLAQGQSPSTFPAYSSTGGQPSFYNGFEQLQSSDIAVLGLINATDLEFICLTPVAANSVVEFEYYTWKSQGGGSWNFSDKNRYTFPATDTPKGTIVRLTSTGAQIGYTGGSFSAVDAGAYVGINNNGSTGSLYSWNPNDDQLMIVTLGGVAVDFVVESGFVGNSVVGSLSSTGGIELAAASFISEGSGNNPDVYTDYHFDAFVNLSGNYGLGFPGLLQARRDQATSWSYGTRAADWDASALGAVIVCPSAELLLFAGVDAVNDAFVTAVNDTVSSLTFDTYFSGTTFGFTGVLQPSVDFATNLTLPAGSTKRFGGASVKNSGNASWNNGKVVLEGASAQTLQGFSDLESINVGSSGATLKSNNGNGRVAIVPGGRLEATGSVNVDATDTLVFRSDATGTAGIGTQSSAITGHVKIERHLESISGEGIGGSGTGWIQIGNLVPGVTAGDLTSQIPGSSAVYAYDQSTSSYIVLSGGTTMASPWDVTPSYTGYFLQVPASETGFTLEFASSSSVTIPADGDVTMTLGTDGDGWNMFVNPFASPISVSQLFTDNAGLSAVYAYSGRNNIYWDAIPDLGGDFSTIDVGQAFWVPAKDINGTVVLSSLVVTPTAKSPSNAPFVRQENENLLGAIEIVAKESANPEAMASTFVSFRSDAESGLDPNDVAYAESWSNARFEIWTMDASGDDLETKLLAQSAGDMQHSNAIPLVIDAKAGGAVEFELQSNDLIPEEACVFLHDLETGESMQLTTGSAVSVDLEANTLYNDRFVLNFSSSPEITSHVGFCSGGVIDLDEIISGAPESLELVDLASGELVATSADQLHHLSAGSYELVVHMGDGCINSKNIEVSDVCMGELTGNNVRDVQDLMSILGYVGMDAESYEVLDSKGADCNCDEMMTNMDILTFLTAFGLECD